MAQLVLAIGSSHSPLLASPPEDYPKHAEIDAKGRKLIDKRGRACTYGDLLEAADPGLANEITMPVLESKAERCNTAIARVADTIAAAKLDALIVIGDDQNEQFFDDNMPAILVYWGDTVVNRELDMPADAPAFWRKARSQYHEESGSGEREYPVDAKLGLHLIQQLMDAEFAAVFAAARRGSCVRVRAQAIDARENRADRAGGTEHLFPAQPAKAQALLPDGAGDPQGGRVLPVGSAGGDSCFRRPQPFHGGRGAGSRLPRRLRAQRCYLARIGTG